LPQKGRDRHAKYELAGHHQGEPGQGLAQPHGLGRDGGHGQPHARAVALLQGIQPAEDQHLGKQRGQPEDGCGGQGGDLLAGFAREAEHEDYKKPQEGGLGQTLRAAQAQAQVLSGDFQGGAQHGEPSAA